MTEHPSDRFGAAPPSPQSDPRISIIVPTLNEAENIDRLIGDVLAATCALGQIEIVIVDDGSTDGTRERVTEWEADPRTRDVVRLLPRDGKKGLAEAVLAGAEIARGEVVVVMDADLSHPAMRIPDLVKPVLTGASDMAIGSRYVAGGSTPDWPARRHLMSRAASLLAWPIADIRDPMSGFFAVRRNRLLEAGARAVGFKIGLEVLVRSGGSLRVTEVPIAFRDRTRGTSKLGWRVVFAYLRGLLALGGGAVSPGTATRFGMVGVLGMLVDLLCFRILISAGIGLGPAHLLSFLAATVFNYTLNARWSFRETAERGFAPGWPRYLRFFNVCLMAVFLRGAVLAFLVHITRWPPEIAIVGSIAAAAVVNYLGAAFYVFAPVDESPPSIRWRVAALGVALYLIALRILYLALPDLLVEEAYYWNYSQHLDLSYLDHPPMVAWMIRLGTALFGDTVFGIRIGAFLCWLAAAFFVYRLTVNLFGKSAAFRSTMLLAALPAFFLFGFFMTPDAPLIAWWAGALYFLERALLGERRLAWWGAGVCLGLGMLSKYTIALLVPATFLFLLTDRRSRRWLSRPEPYAAALVALILFAPVVVWNATHEWASFVFQSIRRLHARNEFSLHLLIGSMLLLLTPTGFARTVKVLLPFTSRSDEPSGGTQAASQKLFLLVFTLVPFSVFVSFSLFHQPKLDWTAPLWLTVLPWLARDMDPASASPRTRQGGRGRRAWPATVTAVMLVYGAAMHYLVLGLPGFGYPQRMYLVGWHDLGRQIERIENDVEKRTGSKMLVVGMDKYNIASELAFYRTHEIRTSGDLASREGVEETAGRHLFGEDSLMYNYWFPPDNQRGRTVILVGKSADDLDGPAVTGRFDTLEPVKQLLARHNDMPAARFYYRIGFGYHSPGVPSPSLSDHAPAGRGKSDRKAVAFHRPLAGPPASRNPAERQGGIRIPMGPPEKAG